MKIKNNIQLTPKLASIIFPIIIGLITSTLLLIAGLLPINEKVNKINSDLKEFKRKSNELDLILKNLENVKLQLGNIYQTKFNLINLIAGDTDLKTLLAKLNTLANETNITIENIKPIKIIKFDQKNNNDVNSTTGNNPSLNQNDPLITPETFKEISSLELIGAYENLISFLKRIEKMENIILINALSLKSSKPSGPGNNSLKIELDLRSYGKINKI